MSIRLILEVAFVGWMVIALAALTDARRDQEREVRRYVAAVCTDGFPPQDFHTEALDQTFHGLLGPELLEGCAVQRRRFEEALADESVRQGVHARSEVQEATWR